MWRAATWRASESNTFSSHLPHRTQAAPNPLKLASNNMVTMLFAQPCLHRPGLFPQRVHANRALPGFRRASKNQSGENPRSFSTAATTASSVGSEVTTATSSLLQAIEGTQRGVATSAEEKQRIELIISVLEKEPTCSSDDGTWELLWTTERETLFILKNNWFGFTAGKVYQIIDRQDGYLQNVITFPPMSAFLVDSTIRPEGERRVNFEFSGAELQLPQRTFKLPPFGKGWFVNVYCDDRIRVSKDIRGDILVCAKAGPPKRFVGMA